ncbi:hypothetical protein [Defluviicoccus vanus]|uniref:Uncharacterized protein n=1 Tax=Defluviicoccus vanus TaxID=111831 RepID=A0A7H1N1W0_9PROT|nr:hypothetical protein [Defluviicoccus vanus]QNT69696.1 hypothetical protein HQ394_10635 [Defluviicoccus vanus]
MNHLLYNIEHDRVDPVFFAVVPDSFMTGSGSVRPHHRSGGEWREEVERPIVASGDRWSF